MRGCGNKMSMKKYLQIVFKVWIWFGLQIIAKHLQNHETIPEIS